ncbi:MAG TPA: AlwI family type II restriction endonuclease [Candidatus Cloacimonas acidaminovorans]|nr:AlwI family type II restriction endonuclease [Candidatus Cloacimonas acidaminovorans]HRS60164.1 AlwI family type II restriction endonuclease [Candidatus Cloacimonas sp.]HOM78732.1 AlwI family type II restriction endonuclease [Candidatus Cloacimonas acidaminovorans]HOS07111.1 AlwI family type II restriction endonuclease [Candidatus Cloacimonas acidaminovorans]HOT38438.1 AlwI family type II restriction endonuclease [Candidatus Cloacimonas acidaminovorans]
MRKPWSISTTVRNPERLRDFLRVLKQLEGQSFDTSNQIKYQVLLIKERIYKPLNIPVDYLKYYEEPETEIPYKVAEQIFIMQKYEDPPMRGRQSVNPLNKLGFSIAREGYGPIIITELGNKFLSDDYEIGYIFFKSLLKLQFPNPWSADFSEKEGFDIMPLIAVMKLIKKINGEAEKKGLDKNEFNLFVPTLIKFDQVDEYVQRILEFRKAKNKDEYINDFAKMFYQITTIPANKINNLFDYGDNIMRYFRLTRYFKVSMDPLGSNWIIDLEPSRKVEIEQLLDMYKGASIKFETVTDYLNYLSDIEQPLLPWEKRDNLEKVVQTLKYDTNNLIKEGKLQISQEQQTFLDMEIHDLDKNQLEKYKDQIRAFNLELKERIKKVKLMSDLNKVEEIIVTLQDIKKLREYEPEQFEKLVTEALKIINDEIQIKPNYPVDDDGEPVSHSPANKPDIECYYKKFKAIIEVTLNSSKLQWVLEGQPVMRHLRNFEIQHQNDEVFCIFIAPRIHIDTYSQFWISVKYEYNGIPQKIVPMTSEQFAMLLDTLLLLLKKGKRFSHIELYELYTNIVNESKRLVSFSNWALFIEKSLADWQQRIIKRCR